MVSIRFLRIVKFIGRQPVKQEYSRLSTALQGVLRTDFIRCPSRLPAAKHKLSLLCADWAYIIVFQFYNLYIDIPGMNLKSDTFNVTNIVLFTIAVTAIIASFINRLWLLL
jgi:hypothetical protein